MPDPHVISALADKAHKLRSTIVSYEEHLERTQHELAVVMSRIAIFERGGVASTDGRPAHVCNLFKRGESLALYKAALADAPAGIYDRCGAYFPDMGGSWPPDEPVLAPKPNLE